MAQTRSKTRSKHVEKKDLPTTLSQAYEQANLSLEDGLTVKDGAKASDGITAMASAFDGNKATLVSAAVPGVDTITPPVLAATNSVVGTPQVPLPQ